MKFLYIAILTLLFSCNSEKSNVKSNNKDANSFLTEVGQEVPFFEVKTIDNVVLNSRQLQGKLIMINFFATWCPPCMKEIPQLETEVWSKYQDKDFILISCGREHKKAELIKFRDEKQVSFPIVADSVKYVYSKFAKNTIPRNYIISRTGKILYQGVGFSEEELIKIKKIIEENL